MVKIRLVRRDKKLIELECTGYTIGITRGVVVAPVPITGERFGADFNVVQSDIRMDCLLVDDDCVDVSYNTSYATATIDFSIRPVEDVQSGEDVMPWLKEDSGDDTGVEIADLDGVKFTITSSDDTEFVITLSTTGETGTVNGNNITIGLANLDGTATTFTARLFNAITDTSDTHNNTAWTAFTSKISTQKTVGQYLTTADAALGFTQVVGGEVGSTGTPTISGTKIDFIPVIDEFEYVEDSGCFSAGDKAQNLIGTVANNTMLGAVGSVGKGIPIIGDGGLHIWDKQYGSEFSDYIVGLQLPFNSLAQVEDTDPPEGLRVEGYNTRNFIYVTGAGKRGKGATSNKLKATTPFIIRDKLTGISGTVTQCDITYDAGATIYKATITFQPLDVMSGL